METAEVARELGVTESTVRGMVLKDVFKRVRKWPEDQPRRGILLFDPAEVAEVKAEREAQREQRKPGRPPKSADKEQ